MYYKSTAAPLQLNPPRLRLHRPRSLQFADKVSIFLLFSAASKSSSFVFPEKAILDQYMKSLNAISTVHPSLFYEPTSVLDPHITSSPSAAAAAAAASVNSHRLLAAPPSLLPAPPAPPADDWDPLSWLLADKDGADITAAAATTTPFDSCFDFPINSFVDSPCTNNWPTDLVDNSLGHVDLLLSAANSMEGADFESAYAMLTQLNLLLPPAHASGNPLQRAASCFKDALFSLLPYPSCFSGEPQALTAVEIFSRIRAQHTFASLSPIPQFTSLTANQTLLEAFEVSSARTIHVIDFDLGLGGQWSSFVQDIAARARSAGVARPAMRLTVVVTSVADAGEASLAVDNLRVFAGEIGVRLTVNVVNISDIGSIRLAAGEGTCIVLSPEALRLVSEGALVGLIRRASPQALVLLHADCHVSPSAEDSLARRVADGIEHSAVLMESLEAAAALPGGGGEEAVRMVEHGVLRPKTFAAIGAWWNGRRNESKIALPAAGLRPVRLSDFAVAQAELLVSRTQVEGYHVSKKDGVMVLSWHGRELASTAAWRC